ncbi:hypothetical protein CRG98_007376 [Punica granatum]|uniref:Reverse transcriptase Ty1/copia-type domain-containing protein n=1 Tax=Punica granatum TaxID=22663 RepID=A0A2I0KUS8_PUNGR|nr:hypothetical protein CRG98_007376 [Punica granatum]
MLEDVKLINEVLSALEIDQNLLSVGQLVERGYRVVFEKYECVILDKEGQNLFRIPMKDKCFSFNPLDKKNMAMKSQLKEEQLWHRRLGQFHSKGVMHLQKNDMASGLLALHKEITKCKTCLLGKQIKLPFKRSSWRAASKLQPIHTDVCGLMPEESLSGSSLESKAYKIYQPSGNKVIVSRDVKFMENEKWRWNEEEKAKVEATQKWEAVPQNAQSEEEELNSEELVDDTPLPNFEEAKEDKKWVFAMMEELNMIEKNQTWDLVERPQDRKAIEVKWVNRTKLKPDGSVNKYKVRLVVKGYAQIWGVDYSETFAPVARLDVIRLLLAVEAQKGCKVYHLDVKSAFLNGVLKEEIYVEQPKGFIAKGKEDKVYKLKKALYGLKQAPRAWYGKIDQYLQNLGFERSLSEITLYVKKEKQDIVILSLYVDDLLVT